MKGLNATVKNIIAILAALNIIAMIGFEYGLPSLVRAAEFSHSSTEEKEAHSGEGTIESVKKEEESKESEAAKTALAKTEVEEEVTEEEQDPDAPTLELTDDHIYLKVGDRFNYMSYIKTMEDVDGSDLSHYIYLDGDVDTSEPGDTELTYRITSTITGKSTSKVLLITIEE